MSLREKSAWACLITSVVVFVPYFVFVFRLFAQGQLTGGEALGAFIGAVIWHAILTAAVHIAIAVSTREERADERDALIESRSFKYAYVVLTTSVFGAVPSVIGLGIGLDPGNASRFLTAVFLSQLILFCFILAEVVKYLTQAVCYRRGS